MAEDRLIMDHRYMQAGIKIINGEEFPWVKTAAAAAVLPWRYFEDPGNQEAEIQVLLLRQVRPESNDGFFLKTGGGYMNDGETPEECVRRNCLRKLGVKLPEKLTRQRETLGFPNVATFPIPLFECEGWEEVSEPTPNCSREIVNLRTAFRMLALGGLYDICTEQSIAHLAADKLRIP